MGVEEAVILQNGLCLYDVAGSHTTASHYVNTTLMVKYKCAPWILMVFSTLR